MGGIAWHHLQYVMGLARLGHEVVFLEDSGDDDWSCYDPSTGTPGSDPTYGLEFTRTVFERVGLAAQWGFYDAHRERWFGPVAEKAHEICERAEVLLNVSEVNEMRPWFEGVPIRALIDTDPVFNQIQHLSSAKSAEYVSRHTALFSFAENISSGASTVPDDGFKWQPTRQPIVLDAWPRMEGCPGGKFTTVMQWESYPALEYEGRRYGGKGESFGEFMDLPQKVGPILELALGTPQAPRTELAGKGWLLTDPAKAAPDPWTYQAYIQQSKAEFTPAKLAYHMTNSGWFSERSAAYLATGRPVVVQQTGFSEWLRAKDGVLPFNDIREAIEQIERVNKDYDFQCRAARDVAVEYFASDKVLNSLLDRAIATSAP